MQHGGRAVAARGVPQPAAPGACGAAVVVTGFRKGTCGDLPPVGVQRGGGRWQDGMGAAPGAGAGGAAVTGPGGEAGWKVGGQGLVLVAPR